MYVMMWTTETVLVTKSRCMPTENKLSVNLQAIHSLQKDKGHQHVHYPRQQLLLTDCHRFI